MDDDTGVRARPRTSRTATDAARRGVVEFPGYLRVEGR